MSGPRTKRVLVVEDEPVIAMTIEDMLADLGFEVVGPASNLVEAQSLVDKVEFDAAVLDININGGRSYVIADELRRRGIPFLFATGYGEEGVDPHSSDVPMLQKPYRQDQIEAALRQLLQA